METRPDIGVLLVRTRRAAGVSQRELGERVGVKQQQIARWEASEYRSTGLGRVMEVARALGVPTEAERSWPGIAAETRLGYGTGGAVAEAGGDAPVRDLGAIAARLRRHGTDLSERYGVQRLGVFGSFATGDQTASSDVDLLVTIAHPAGLRFVDAASYVERLLGRAVDFVEIDSLPPDTRARALEEVVYVWPA